MDEIFYGLAGVAFVGLVLFGPWILVWRGRSRRKLERAEDQARWRELTARVYELEQAARANRAQPAASGARSYDGVAAEPYSRPAPTVATWDVRPTPPAEVPTAAPFEQPTPEPVAEATPSVRLAENWVLGKTAAPEPFLPAIPPAIPSAPTPGAWTAESFAKEAPSLSLSDRFKSLLDVEEILGTNWLNKLGIVSLVLGIAFLLANQLKTFKAPGRILVGFVTAAVILGLGIWFERRDRYRILARAGVGGGWALAFFTTYAMYHVPAAQIMTSQAADLVLMLVVAAAMVLHTLRYRSQVVTGLAFLLAFLTVTINHANVFSLSAGAVLATGLVVIVGRMHWYELEVFGILASYLNHYLWLRPIIEAMHGKRRPFPEFAASAGILILYWLIFRLSYVLRKPGNEKQEHISTAAALLNSILLLVLLKYQSVHPEWAFWALLAFGAAETMLGQLPVTRRRRTATIVLSTVGVTLLIAAFPFRYSGARLSVLWLLEAEALLLIGVWTKEVVFRRLGMLGALLVSGQMIGVDAAQVFGRRMDGADLSADFRLMIVFVVAAAVLYASAHWVLRRWADLFTTEIDRRVMQRFSYVAAIMMLVGAWIGFPQSWTAVAWCIVGLGLAVAARRLNIVELAYQAFFLGAVSVVRVLSINLDATEKHYGLTLRLVTILTVSVLLYITTRWNWATDAEITIVRHRFSYSQLAVGSYTWTASFLLALLAWYELRPISVADAWLVGGLILLEIGLERKKLSLRLQGYTAFAASFLRIFFVNLNAAGEPGQISPRFYTVVPLALGFFYAYSRLHDEGTGLSKLERRCEGLCCWLGTITFAALARFELPADWVAAAWAALVLALLILAYRSERRIFLYQGLLLALGVVSRTVLHNFYERSYFPAPAWQSRWITAGVGIALLTLSLPFAFQLRRKNEASTATGLRRLLQFFAWRPEQMLFFFAVGLLTALLAIEMRHGMVTLAWGVEGLAVFLLALRVGERSFRLTGLGLLLLCVGKILLVDVWALRDFDRYMTLMVLGGALLLVSFLYTRNREALRRYL